MPLAALRFSCCGTQAPSGNSQMRVEIFGAFTSIPEGHLGTATNPAPGCEELAGVVNADGPYFLRRSANAVGTAVHEVYCDLTTPGLTQPDQGPGGWALLLKATRGGTFSYDADYWTAANVLHADDVTLDDGDAKYRVFNEMTITEVMAKWPESPDGGNLVWKVGPFAATTALELFQRPEVLSSSPQSDAAFDPDLFSSQDGNQLYSIDHQTAAKSVRWGFSWNNEGDWTSNDVIGGIGLGGSAAFQWSAGDFFGCCGRQAPSGNTQMRVEVYGRYGGALQGALGTETNPAASCGEFRDAGNTHSEAIWVGYGAEISQVFCEMSYEGGGWTLLMKATQGETFAYDSPHWTTPTVLNPDDVTLNEGDAKYDAFNSMVIDEVMAHWMPDQATGMSDFYWRTTLYQLPMSALDLFGHDNIIIEECRSECSDDDPVLGSSNWNPFFSYQDGARRFSINHADGTNTHVRWGYSWNNEADFNTNDALGGIGLGGPVSYSAGDVSNQPGAIALFLTLAATITMRIACLNFVSVSH